MKSTLFATAKSKVIAAGLVVSLVATGAVAGASNTSFTAFVNDATDSLFTKAAGWAGYSVQHNADVKKADVEAKVASEFQRANGEVGGHFNTKVAAGNTLVNNEASGLLTEIVAATSGEITDAKGRIDAEVDKEVTENKASLQTAAQVKAKALIDAVNAQVPAPPAH